MSLIKRIQQAKEKYWLDNGIDADFIIIRPELRADLIMEKHLLTSPEETIQYDIEEIEGMHIAISEDPFLFDFRLGIYNCR